MIENYAEKKCRVSIKEAADKVFNDEELPIPRSTIQTWLQKGVFTPAEPAKSRDPRGCRLSVSDLVVLCLLRSFFFLNIKYSLISQGWRNRHYSWDSDRISGKDPEMRKELHSIEGGRPLQVWLEKCDYEVVIILSQDPLWDVQGVSNRSPVITGEPYIRFCHYGHPRIQEAKDRILGSLSPVVFVDCLPHYDYVSVKLDDAGLL